GLLLVEQAAIVFTLDVLPFGGPGVVGERPNRTGAVLPDLARPVLGGREHADEPYVAAEGEDLEAVLRLSASSRPQGAAEADEVLGGLDVETLPGHEMPNLMQCDRDHHQSKESDGASEI